MSGINQSLDDWSRRNNGNRNNRRGRNYNNGNRSGRYNDRRNNGYNDRRYDRYNNSYSSKYDHNYNDRYHESDRYNRHDNDYHDDHSRFSRKRRFQDNRNNFDNQGWDRGNTNRNRNHNNNNNNDYDFTYPDRKRRRRTGRDNYGNTTTNNNNNNNHYDNRDRNRGSRSHWQDSPGRNTAAKQRTRKSKEEINKRYPNGGRFGYATLVMKGDGYIPGALMLGHSLKLTNTKHSLIVMVTDDVSKDGQKALSLIYDFVVVVPCIEYSTKQVKKLKTVKQEKKYNTWMCASFTKWNVLKLNEYISKQELDNKNRNRNKNKNKNKNKNNNEATNDKDEKEKEKEKDSDKDKEKQSKEKRDQSSNNEKEKEEKEKKETDNNNNGGKDEKEKEKENENDKGKEVESKGGDDNDHSGDRSNTEVERKIECKTSGDNSNKIENEFVEFDRILFLDSDKVVLSNLDNIFIDIDKCPAGTFSSPWANEFATKRGSRYESSAMYDVYAKHQLIENDIVPRECIYNGLMNNGFVAVGTGMLFEPNINDFNQFVKMLEAKDISDVHAQNNHKNNINETKEKEKGKKKEKEKEKAKGTENEDDNENKQIGFSKCYSMSDEQSIVYYFYSQNKDWSYIDVRYNFIPWKFKWLENDCRKNAELANSVKIFVNSLFFFFFCKIYISV